MYNDNNSAMYDFLETLTTQQHLFEGLDAKQVKSMCIAIARQLLFAEHTQLLEAFKYGFQCSGKTDDETTLANLYYQVKFNEQLSKLQKEMWYAEAKRDSTRSI